MPDPALTLHYRILPERREAAPVVVEITPSFFFGSIHPEDRAAVRGDPPSAALYGLRRVMPHEMRPEVRRRARHPSRDDPSERSESRKATSSRARDMLCD